jgi:ribonucleoside-diphosphate reductase alpha chain
LKTGMYYLRTQAAAQAVQFTVEKQGSRQMVPVVPGAAASATDIELLNGGTCSMEDGCVSCSA